MSRRAITIIVGEINRLKKLHPMVAVSSKEKKIIIHAPALMSIDEGEANKEKILDFIICIRDFIKSKFRAKTVDFSTIKLLSPLCAMLLISEVHRWQLLSNKKLRVHRIEDWHPSVRQILNDIGFFALVESSNPPAEIDIEEKFLKIRSGQKLDLKESISLIGNEVKNIGLIIKQNPELYGGIEEAITNVTQWDYHEHYEFDYDNKKHELHNRWWFCASYNKKEGKVTVMVQDHGLGIPVTLGASNWWDRIKASIGDDTDNHGKIIKEVMNSPRSASGKNHRAKGLKKMRQLLSRFNKGKLTIISGKGWYEFRHNKGDINQNSAEGNYGLHKYSIYGTLVIWEIYPIWKE